MDNFVFEVNNLILKLTALRNELRDNNKEDKTLIFNDSKEKVNLFKMLMDTIVKYSKEKKKLTRGEVIYILSAFLKWELEKVVDSYYNKLKQEG